MAKKLNEQELFNSIVENAFDFLHRSVEELETLPKYSIIHFWSSIELFFKARLLKEHWTLIFADVDNANQDKILSGDFISTSYDITVKRLSNLISRPLQKQALDSFTSLRKRRNQLIHFFNNEYTAPMDENTLNSIVAEQCRGWFYLHDLLTRKWEDEFSAHQMKISELHEELKKQRGYLQAKYEGLKDSIEQGMRRGIPFRPCFSCNYISQKIVPVTLPFYKYDCLVCSVNGVEVHIDCPKCKNQMKIEDGEGECPSCGNYIDTEKLVELYNPELERFRHDDPFRLDIACDGCGQPTTVIPLNNEENEFSCLACANVYKTFQIEECPQCSGNVAVYSFDDIIFGCTNCR
jgi:Zn finger protein HypA/HybF involved in hydrogenase expression